MKDKKGYLTEEQVNAILNSATNIRDRLILQLLYRCGRRVSEVLMLTEDDIFWDDKQIIFNILKRKKPVKEIKIVDDDTFELLRTYAKEKDNIRGLRKKPTENRLFPISRQYVYKLIRKLGKGVGIERVGNKWLHPHHLRHSFAVHQVKGNIKSADDLRKLQMYMGHASLATTADYLQYSPDELKSIVDMWNKRKVEKEKK